MNNLITLDLLPINTSGKIKKILSSGITRRRMLDLGLIPKTIVKPLMRSPSKDPTAYEIRGTVVAIRSEEAKKIIVERLYTIIGDI
ncbi:MAG TPA: ferrous iron transport protein A [Mollicutes bacterium]|jgi:ferrous iron transport protein A|nr:ferrous iron transport protein A [Mollicutes bacterium]